MTITKTAIDATNAIITIQLTKEDYQPKVSKILEDYRKKAAIPGFRKGAVPLSLIQKQYGKAVLFDEVNKILQEKLNNYISTEKISLLGNPIPKMNENFNWDNENFDFDFEIGIAPEFSVDLNAKNNITKYKIIADEAMIAQQIERIQKQYGKLISQPEIKEGFEVRGIFRNEEYDIDAEANFALNIFENKEVPALFLGKKVGDVVALQTKGLFDDDHKLMDYLKVSHDQVHGLDTTVHFTIEEINQVENAVLDQELFDKLLGPGNVTSVEELKTKIKEDSELQFVQQTDQQFLNDVTEFLIESTKFDLPEAFLKKWIQTSSEKPLTEEQAAEEFDKAEKGIRFQLIEAKILADNNIKITFEDLKEHTSKIIKNQMAQFGQLNPTDEEINGIVARVMTNQDEVKRLSEQVIGEKVLDLYKEKITAPEKEVTFADFVKIMYGEK